MKSLTKFALIASAVLILVYFVSDLTGCNPQDLKGEIEVLHKTNDSLETQVEVKTKQIDELNIKDAELTEQLEEAKENIKVVKVYVEKEVQNVKSYDSLAVAKFFTNRFPKESELVDTLIPLGKPVLVSAAAQLVEFDGAKQILKLQDSVVSLQDKKILLKDSVIGIMYSKEKDYRHIITNKDLEINNWLQQNKELTKQNNRLKKKVKVVTFGLIGVTGYFLLRK